LGTHVEKRSFPVIIMCVTDQLLHACLSI
jgi:hypothetical protein